jgi:outer membrane receptor protein involved in Fe transport
VNYTYNKSEAEYLRTRIKLQIDPQTFRTTMVNDDTTYTNPLIFQPDHLLNLIMGYDFKGFSMRLSARYRSHMFIAPNWYESFWGYSTDLHRYDLAIRQKLPVKGMEFFLNINNLTNEIERDVINHMNFANYLEDYGRNANLGLRYQF